MNIIDNKMTCQDFIDIFGRDYPLLAQFKDTQQDSQWHAEGDVHIHTDMVINEVYGLINSEASHLPSEQKKILLLSALFHDYAKPITTQSREINALNRVVAPKHENMGASLLFNLPPPLNISPKDWLSVIQLTAYHHIPKLLILKNKGYRHYARLSRQVTSLELLYFLEYADMRGRTCDDKQDQLDIMDMFKIEAKEHGLWTNDPYENLLPLVKENFPDKDDWLHRRVCEHAKVHVEEGTIFMPEEEISIAYQYLDQPHLILTCGMAGAGKSSWIDKTVPHYYRIELDAIRDKVSKGRANQSNNNEVVRIAHEELKQALRDKKNIVWDATNYRSDFRKRIIDLGVAYGAFTEIVCFQKPLAKLIADNNNREHAVPKDNFERMLNKFQWPEVGEAHILNIVHT